MRKSRVLFAATLTVAALSAPVAASPRVHPAIAKAQEALISAYRWEAQATAAYEEVPRLLASGAPACGNANSKAPPRVCRGEEGVALSSKRLEQLVAARKATEDARVVLEKATRTYGHVVVQAGPCPSR